MYIAYIMCIYKVSEHFSLALLYLITTSAALSKNKDKKTATNRTNTTIYSEHESGFNKAEKSQK